jgi:REP element-mobilizing transposase RayT
MAIYAQILYHVVFTTKHREARLGKLKRPDLYQFMWEHLKARHCKLHRIGGTEDHVHLLIALHPAVALGALVKELKVLSETWIKSNYIYKPFDGWQEGYAAFTHALPERERLIESIKDQEELHKSITFREEFEELLDEAGLKIADDDEEWFDSEEGTLDGGLYKVMSEDE